VAGIWGTLAVGIFGSVSFLTQLWGILLIGVFVTISSSIVWLILKAVMGIRVSEEEEMDGLDKSELGMEAYPEFGK
jgi:Amt family ammonium transporter